MYRVVKGFTSQNISASKGKIIDIKDKKIINNLLDAGVIEPFSNKEVSAAEKDKEITFLKGEVSRLEQEKSALIVEKENLQAQINTLENTQENEPEANENLEKEVEDENQIIEETLEKEKEGEKVASPEKSKKE